MADQGTLPTEVDINSTLQEDREFERPAQFAGKVHFKTLAEGISTRVRQRPEVAGCEERRPGCHSMGMTPGLPIAMLARLRITNSEM